MAIRQNLAVVIFDSSRVESINLWISMDRVGLKQYGKCGLLNGLVGLVVIH